MNDIGNDLTDPYCLAVLIKDSSQPAQMKKFWSLIPDVCCGDSSVREDACEELANLILEIYNDKTVQTCGCSCTHQRNY